MPKSGSDLSVTDIEFLRTVRNINANPDEYAKTDVGEVPANLSALKEVLLHGDNTLDDWTEGKLDYRMREGDRGWLERDEGSFNLAILHPGRSDPSAPSGYIVRSIELTERGKRQIDKAEKEWGFDDVDSDTSGVDTGQLRVDVDRNTDQLEEVKDSLDAIQEELAEMNEYLSYIQGASTGAMDSELADHLDLVFDLNLRHERLFKMVLDVDTDPLQKGTNPSDAELREVEDDLESWLATRDVGQAGGAETTQEAQND